MMSLHNIVHNRMNDLFLVLENRFAFIHYTRIQVYSGIRRNNLDLRILDQYLDLKIFAFFDVGIIDPSCIYSLSIKWKYGPAKK